MAINNLIRSSGIALILTSIFYFADIALHPDNAKVNAMLDPGWKPAHIVEGLAYLFLVLGLVGFYLRQAEEVGKLGLVGFILALFGATFTMNEGLVYHAYLLPFMATHYPTPLSPNEWYAATGPVGPELAYIIQFHNLAQVGQIMLGIATVRAGIFSRWPAWLLTFGQAVLVVYLIAPDNIDTLLFPVLAIGVLGIGVSYAWFGYALLKPQAAPGTNLQPVLS